MVIFFDIDETLLNQRGAEAAAAEPFLREYGHVLPDGCGPAEFCRLWRSLREKHLPEFLNGSVSYREHHRRRMRDLFLDGAGLTDREADERYQRFLDGYRRAWCLFPDVLPCLDALAGHHLAVLSNGSVRQQRSKLERTGVLHRFSAVLVSEEFGTGKPDPEIFRAACRRVGRAPEECVYVGDRLGADARASSAAGMRGIWLDRSRSGASPGVEVVHSLGELAALFPAGRNGRSSVNGAFVALEGIA
ncbi:MAG TPA: HAD family hydrolase [Planctomycetaceae bacterium]